MLFSRIPKKQRKRQCAWLYSIVFHGAISTCTIAVLFLSFLIQPLHKAFAAEAEIEVAIPAVADEVMEHSTELEAGSSEDVSSIIVEEDVATEAPDVVLETGSGESPISEPLEEISETLPLLEEEINNENPDSTDGVNETYNELPSDNGSDAGEQVPLVTEEQEEVAGSPKETDVVELQGLITEENFYQFSKQSCVAIGDGTYHCSTDTNESPDTASSVYAEKGESGNMEIFLRTASQRVVQVTDNAFDDTAPHFDPETLQVVWQRLIDGRYQIIVYDIKDEQETQLTFSRTNNMEPKVSSAGIVWQAWDDNDWEVMFFDGSFTEQLTSNSAQDVAPVIQDRYVLWNVLGGEEQQAKVYSLDTKETLSIEGYEGGAISNPRFVLVYDTQFDNGDIITQSFDPVTGLSEPIAAKPAPAPIDIPDSDPIGEIRALISNKSKDEHSVVAVDVSGEGGAPPVDGESLNLKTLGDTQSTTTSTSLTASEPVFELTEYDLVIPQGSFSEALEITDARAQ